MIEVRDLVKNFGPTRAVRAISFQVEKGEVVGFLGPNGAGKTTTIRVLTCFHPATSGTARVAGLDVFRDSLEVRRRIGYLPETVPLYHDMRVVEYLRFRARLKGVPRARVRGFVEEAMDRCGVRDVARKPVAHVSRGYRQRVGLADALVAKPPVLILDEPTTGLDPNQRRRLKDLVRELAREHTILFSSHVLAEVEDVSDRVLIIHEGTIRADGTPEELTGQARAGRHVRVTVRAPAQVLEGILAETPGIRGETVGVEEEGGGFATGRAEPLPGEDPRLEIFTRVRAAGLDLRELVLLRPSLEQFFHQITQAQAEEAVEEEQAPAP